MAATMNDIADGHYKKAKLENTRSQTNQKLKLNKISRARSGRLDKFWRQ